MNAVEREECWFETEELSKTDIYNELLMTGLRMAEGINTDQLNEILPPDPDFHSQVSQLQREGLMEIHGTSIRLTKTGRLQADRIASDLFRLNT